MRHKASVRLALVAAVACWLASPPPFRGQATSTMTNMTNVCVANTYKYAFPNFTAPTFVFIGKFLAAPTSFRVCDTSVMGGMNNAFCNPGVPAATMTLAASAVGPQITMMPSCSWYCAGCATNVTTTAAGDGLPVELMGFGFEDEASDGSGR